MTEQTKAVFNDPKLLREKLNEFLQTPEKVEIYAKAAEKFFNAGGRQKLKYTSTWSWWGFFGSLGGAWFFLYRKIYVIFFVSLALQIGLVIFLNLFTPRSNGAWIIGYLVAYAQLCAQLSKFTVIDRFSKALDSDELENKGGVNTWGIYLAIGITGINVIFIILFIYEFNNAMP